MPDYEVVQDDHLKYVTVHETPPELEPVIESSEAYRELEDHQSDDQLEWITDNYDRSILEDVDSALNRLENVDGTEWELSLETTPMGAEEIGARLRAQVTADYEFKVVGYGTAGADAQAYILYNGDSKEKESGGKISGDIELNLPEHVAEDEKKAALRNVEEDLVVARESFTETLQEALSD